MSGTNQPVPPAPLPEFEIDWNTDHVVIGYCWLVRKDGVRLSLPNIAAWEIEDLRSRLSDVIVLCDNDPAVKAYPTAQRLAKKIKGAAEGRTP